MSNEAMSQPSDIFGIVLGMVGPHARPVPTVPRHPLAQVEHDRTGRVGLFDPAVVFDDLLRRYRRTIAFLPAADADLLRIVGFVAVHPAD